MHHPGIPLDNQKLRQRHEEIVKIVSDKNISHLAAVDILRDRFRKRYNGLLFECIANELNALEEAYRDATNKRYSA